MAIFGKKKNEKETIQDSSKKEVVKVVSRSNLHGVLISPRITEKATDVTAGNAYVFNVIPSASKKTIKNAVKLIYKVDPAKVSVVTIPRKKIIVRGKKGVKAGGKKAYVYLKPGDKIEFV